MYVGFISTVCLNLGIIDVVPSFSWCLVWHHANLNVRHTKGNKSSRHKALFLLQSFKPSLVCILFQPDFLYSGDSKYSCNWKRFYISLIFASLLFLQSLKNAWLISHGVLYKIEQWPKKRGMELFTPSEQNSLYAKQGPVVLWGCKSMLSDFSSIFHTLSWILNSICFEWLQICYVSRQIMETMVTLQC